MTRALAQSAPITHSVTGSNLADLLERILDKGIVIAGEIKVNIVDIELLSIQIRLVVCSIDKAREIGINFWETWPDHANGSGKRKALKGPSGDSGAAPGALGDDPAPARQGED